MKLFCANSTKYILYRIGRIHIIGIYKIENLITHQCYIGQTVNMSERWRTHRNIAFRKENKKYNYPLYSDMRKYGVENFSFEVLEECSVSELNQKEIDYIKQYNTFVDGYNQNSGGGGNEQIYEQHVSEIIDSLLNTSMTECEIAQRYEVPLQIVQGINVGKYWKRDISYPIRVVLNSAEPTQCDSTIVKKGATYHCLDCGVPITHRIGRCVPCALKKRSKNKPSKEVLYKLLVKHQNFSLVANLFGVSGNAVKKWCKSYNMPHLISAYVPQKEEKSKKPFYPPRPIAMIDLHTGKTIKTFPSKHSAEIELRGKATDAISHVLQGKCKSMYGYGWKYVDELN